MINRILYKKITERFFRNKALIILGPRQTGKTTLLKQIESENKDASIWLDCDEPDIREKLTNVTSTQLKNLIGNKKFVFIDEAQRIENIGLTLKLITDNLSNIQLLVSGSSALEISGKINETLTGRKFEFRLYPFSLMELSDYQSNLIENRLVENRLIYGYYPDVVNNPGDEELILKELVDSYLYKDILLYKEIRKPHILPKLLKLLALQIGSEVSTNELAQNLQVDRETIERYLDLLEKSFIIFRLGSFSRNLRTELNKSKKIYFVDNGIRNSLISNFNPIELRTDKGALWENFLISEKIKYNSYHNIMCSSFFWRTHQKQEIDYIEEKGGKLHAWEFKWDAKSKAKIPQTFIDTYPDSLLSIIDRENFWSFFNEEI
jgi:predicted AAA+ superfamily ATPase